MLQGEPVSSGEVQIESKKKGKSAVSNNEGTVFDEEGRPQFESLDSKENDLHKTETRKIFVPAHRMKSIKENWMKIYTPLVEQLKLQVRMNLKGRTIELRTSKYTEKAETGDKTYGGVLQRGEDFIKAVITGFDVEDATVILRLDDVYVESFEVGDVKQVLHGDKLKRSVGRIAGRNGTTKYAIENATRTRIVIQDKKISILGSVNSIRPARDAICRLIIGSEPGKIYTRLRSVSARMKGQYV